jgi:membrane fusion protein, copper/silver efflux system
MKRKNVGMVMAFVLAGILLACFIGTGWTQQEKQGKEKAKAPVSSKPVSEEKSKGPEASGASPKEEENLSVEIPPEKQQLIGVKTVAVAARPLQKTIRAVGRIDYDERKLATVSTKFGAWIDHLYVDYTGKHVRKGEPLAEIYSPEVNSAEQEYIFVQKCYNYKSVMRWERIESVLSAMDVQLCQAMLNEVEVNLWQRKLRFQSWDIPEDYLKKIMDKGEPIKTLTIYSPIDGYVVQKPVVLGKRVEAGEKLFDIADLSTVYVIADIFAYELPMIKLNQEARISLSYFPGKEFTSRIDLVYPSFSGETRTAKVRFTIPNPGGQLKPQMFTNAVIKIDLGKKLTIPEDAVIDTGARQIVYVNKGEGYFEPREVILGLKVDGMVEVTKGLKAGEKVASSANFLIDSEAKLKGITP